MIQGCSSENIARNKSSSSERNAGSSLKNIAGTNTENFAENRLASTSGNDLRGTSENSEPAVTVTKSLVKKESLAGAKFRNLQQCTFNLYLGNSEAFR